MSCYMEVFALLNPGGSFLNVEHVASATECLHDAFLAAIGYTRETEDRSNILLDVETQLRWLREMASRTSTVTGSGARWRCWAASSRTDEFSGRGRS